MAEYAAGGSAGLSVIGGFVGADAARSGAETTATGLMMKGQAEHDAAYFNAGQYEYQALIDERDRAIALDQAASDAADSRMKAAAVNGQIRTAYGSSGLALEGSPLDVLQANAIEQGLDTKKILYSGDVVAAGLTDKANQARAQASLLRYVGDNALTAARYGASSARLAGQYASATSIISGFAGAAKSATSFATRA